MYYWKCRYIQDFANKHLGSGSDWKQVYETSHALKEVLKKVRDCNEIHTVRNSEAKAWVVKWTNLVINNPRDVVVIGKLDGAELVPLSLTEIMICKNYGWESRSGLGGLAHLPLRHI